MKLPKEKPTLGSILKIITSFISILIIIISIVTTYDNINTNIAINKAAIELNTINIKKDANDLLIYKNKRDQIDIRMLESIKSVEIKLGDVKVSNAVVIERVGNLKAQITSLKRDYNVIKK